MVQHAPDQVAGAQGEVDQLAAYGNLTRPDQIENRLHFVGKGGDVVETEHGPRPLDGVHVAKHGTDEIRVPRIVFQFQERGFQKGQVFISLFLEGGAMDIDHDLTSRPPG